MVDISTVPRNPSIVFAGSVESSRVALKALLKRGAHVTAVFGLAASAAGNVSGYSRLDDLAHDHGIPYVEFIRINDPAVVDAMHEFAPDLLWVVGLSQLVGAEVRGVPSICTVGFHPTRLPEGRGRAAMAWNVLKHVPLAATFFMIDDGIDSGPILAQVDVDVDGVADDLSVRYQRIYEAIPRAIDVMFADFASGRLNAIPQDEARATYLGTRRPSDGVIDWSNPTRSIRSLIAASGPPHPAAFTYYRDTRICISRATSESPATHTGVPGRIVEIHASGSFVVATADGCVTAEEYSTVEPWAPAVGMRLGFDPQVELAQLRRRVRRLEAALAALVPGYDHERTEVLES